MKRKVLSIFILSANLLNLTAQNMTNSPASMFGLGELSTGEGGIYSGMGGVGIALRGENAYNSANPASLTGLMPQYFFFDLGVSGAYEKYSQSGANNHSFNGNLNNLGAGFRIAPRWYGAIFMAPVSSVGYAISLEQDVAGTNGETVTSLFQGEGGLSKVGISVAHQLWKGLSLGANFSYVGGTITQSESQGSATETNSSYKHTVYVDFGLQYTYEIERDRSLVAGAVYGYSQDLLQDNDHSVSSSSSSGSITQSESQGSATETNSSYKHTVYVDFGLQYTYEIERDRSLVAGAVYGYSQDLLQDNDHSVSSSSSSGSITEKGKKYRTCLPQFFGVGVSYNTLRWMASADYKFVDWSRLESSRSSVSFHNQHRLMLGGSYTLGNPYRKPVRLLLGAGIGNSYLSIQNKTTTNYYLSTGINFEYRSRSTLSLGVKYTDQFKVSSGRFQGQKLAFFLNITFSEKTYRAKLK